MTKQRDRKCAFGSQWKHLTTPKSEEKQCHHPIVKSPRAPFPYYTHTPVEFLKRPLVENQGLAKFAPAQLNGRDPR